MGTPAPVDVGDALEDLINQFSDPMSFFRELIQNALDAGSDEVDIDFEFQASSANADSGAMIVNVTDYGEGMDRAIIDSKLTRLFSSAKDGDMTKIGKFGIGFVSVFAIQPDAVCVDTARAGEAWRVLFDRERKFKRLRLDEAIEGTKIRIIKNSTRDDYNKFVTRARQVVRYWCGHANGEVRFCGELVSERFGLEATVTIAYEDEFSHVHIGHRPGGETLHAFFNGGLTLVQADANHGSVVQEFIGLSFKVSSRYLEHTLTRDDVIKDGHFNKVVSRLRELTRGQLRDRVFETLDAAIRAQNWADERAGGWVGAGPAAARLAVLYEAAAWHLRDNNGLPRAQGDQACARSPGGRIWTWSELRKAVGEGLFFASARTPLSDAMEASDHAVLMAYGGVNEHEHDGDRLHETMLAPLIRGCRLASQLGTLLAGYAGDGAWLGERWFMPLAPEPGELRQWAALGNMAQRLLDDSDHRIAKVEFGRFAASGSLLAGRAAISQSEFGETTPVAEAGELGKRLFSRRRVLVIDADHPTVRTLLGLSLREPELAAYQLVKLFLLLGGSISAASDSQLADLSMRYRETRCPQPMS